MLPSILAMMPREAANLDATTVRAVRAAAKWKKDDGSENEEVLKETFKVINNICARMKAAAPVQQSVKLSTATGTAEIQYDGQCLWVNGDKMISQ